MYIPTYIHTHVCMYICIHICIYMYIYIQNGTSHDLFPLAFLNTCAIYHTGVYVYFLTPNYPYAPACLRRARVGAVADSATLPDDSIRKCKQRSWGT